MQEFHTTISENGRVTIPATIRKELNLKSGADLIIKISPENDIILHSPKQSLQRLQGMFKAKKKTGLVEELIEMRRKEKI
jgi:AbrB family looped-hinge helix DNA binding protein